MIKFLKIKNIAIINESKIEFNNGFNCLTGETGAGKSIIIDSLNFVLGAKADKNLINSKCDYAQVDCIFDISNFGNKEKQEIFELIGEVDDEIQLSRTLTSQGKSTFKINGDISSSTIVKKISNFLIDIFGQNDHQLLVDTRKHIGFLDDFINQKTQELVYLKNQLSLKLERLADLNEEIDQLGGIGEDKEKKLELITYEINEIENANLYLNEDDELLDKKKLMQNSEKIYSSLNNSIEELERCDILNILKSSSNCLKPIENFTEHISILKDKLIDLKFELEDVISNLNEIKNNTTYSEIALNQIEDRLELINNLKRKYGNSIEQILNYLDLKKSELEKIKNNDELLNISLKNKNIVLEECYNFCKKITDLRKKYSLDFENELLSHIFELGMENAKFKIYFKNCYSKENIESCVTKNGADDVEFLFSANLGQELKPLANVLSGGEMSRFMLAFKCVLSSSEKYKTYIFDEIDAGIGGSIGSFVGKKITNISTTNQVLCITHLAQIACFADYNFKIEKNNIDNKTIASIKLLNNIEKVNEISRMIGIVSNGEFANMHANEIISEASDYKNLIKLKHS